MWKFRLHKPASKWNAESRIDRTKPKRNPQNIIVIYYDSGLVMYSNADQAAQYNREGDYVENRNTAADHGFTK